MLGGILTNIKIPFPPVPSPIEFLAIPSYAFGSKKFSGLGFARYNFFSDGYIRKVTLGVIAATFSMDKYTDENGNSTFLRVQKIVPNLRLTLNEKNPRSTLNRFIQFKTFLIGEDALRFYQDTIRNPPAPDTVVYKYRTTRENTTRNQLMLVVENYRALYPYRGEIKIEQGEDF